MEGLAAVTARVAQIQAMLAPAAVRLPTGPSSAPSAGTTTFAVALRSAEQASGGTAQLSAAHLSSAAQLSALGRLPGAAPLPGSSAASLLAQLSPTSAPPAPAGVAGSTRADVAAFKAAWPNGRISPENLTPIGGGHSLAGPAAPAFQRLVAAAARDGVTFGVNDSYRSFQEQVALARSKGLYSQGGLAATPGTSQHGWGLAVDLDLDAEAQPWMRAHGPRFGFHEDVPREPWHWTFQGV